MNPGHVFSGSGSHQQFVELTFKLFILPIQFARNHDSGGHGDGEPTDLPTPVAAEFLRINIQRDGIKSLRYGGII